MTTPADNLWAAERCERDAQTAETYAVNCPEMVSSIIDVRAYVASLRDRAERFRAAAKEGAR